MEIFLYGVRGSIPAPLSNEEYREKVISILRLVAKSEGKAFSSPEEWFDGLPEPLNYVVGGNTTCVRIIGSSGVELVVDLGTGARVLGEDLVREKFGQGKGEASVFFTHTHWDHIHGIPFFKPLYIPGNKFTFYSPLEDLPERLKYQQEPRFFPIHFDHFGSERNFHRLQKGEVLEIGGVKIEWLALKHPGGSIAYKFTENGKSFIFATDAEYNGEDFPLIQEQKPFFKGADLLVLDAQYTLDESFQKFDWGHTAYTMAVNCASSWEVKKLALTHHEPAYSDEILAIILDDARTHAENLGTKDLSIVLAREGMKFKLV
ncbi:MULTISPECIES: MBL fold metallo-hydrolase [Leptospira]|uniref:MBL fold metallo-hydrolase n=1 Tax=Leptospira haakeii TaxID=2023198 RepID=A0ABX4PL96_9LEPT|nr:MULTISPECIES: MBL fold metallo-hydrolase [Leptospira]PKA14824.1 MBL fold metallo-hydrolase [Leptospira haakeii]PKA18546.1 MBL fold metallo-hydrolase [Leptospira haakeii]TGK04667.1 MBL fold metallo-hydrolase [Leptospira selangorensis]